MLKITVLASVALALVCAFPQDADQFHPQQHQEPVNILKQESEVDVNGYNFEFETSDGTNRQEQGEYKNDTEQQGLLVRGSYSYIAPDGQHIAVSFVADKNGYQPQQHLDAIDARQSSEPRSLSAGSQAQFAEAQPQASEPQS